MSNFLGALVCLKQTISRPQLKSGALMNQIIQSVNPIFPNDKIFNKIVNMFVSLDYDKFGKYRSRAITGEPICAYIQTDKESWLVAITRSVMVEWPECDFSDEAMFKRAMDISLNRYTKKYEGTVFGCRVHSVNLDEFTKQLAGKGPQILRKTEGCDILAFSMNGKVVEFKKGFRIKIGKDGKGRISALGNIQEQMQYTSQQKQRAKDVFSPNVLAKLWDVYSTIERDSKLYNQYIKGEIVGEPIDHRHPVVRFHMTVYENDFSASYGGWGHIPGVAPVGSNGNPYYRKTRVEISAPENGERLMYKSEIALYERPKLELGYSR